MFRIIKNYVVLFLILLNSIVFSNNLTDPIASSGNIPQISTDCEGN